MPITEEVLAELVQDTVAARRVVEQRIRDLESQIADLDRERDELLKEEEGHKLALARLFPHAASATSPSGESSGQSPLFPIDEDLSRISRTDAIEKAVHAINAAEGRPASPAEIEDYLSNHHRSDTRDQIGAALSYLRVSDRIQRVGRGQWAPLSNAAEEAS